MTTINLFFISKLLFAFQLVIRCIDYKPYESGFQIDFIGLFVS